MSTLYKKLLGFIVYDNNNGAFITFVFGKFSKNPNFVKQVSYNMLQIIYLKAYDY